jgi:hypothetical protein
MQHLVITDYITKNKNAASKEKKNTRISQRQISVTAVDKYSSTV